MATWMARTRDAVAEAFDGFMLLATLLVTTTVLSVGRGAFVFSFRDGLSRMALWLSPVVDLTKALPSLFRILLERSCFKPQSGWQQPPSP